jgi:hypothetical protein
MDQYLEDQTLPEMLAVNLLFPLFVAWQISVWMPVATVWRVLIALVIFAIVSIVAMYCFCILTCFWNDWLKNMDRPKPPIALVGGCVSSIAILGAGWLVHSGTSIVPWAIVAVIILVFAPAVRVMGVPWD